MKILESASKICLLSMVAVLNVLALVAGIHGVLAGTFSDIEKTVLAAFVAQITFIFGFYFNSKGDETQPYGGK